MALSSFCSSTYSFNRLYHSRRRCKKNNYLLSTTRMPGKGGLGGATSSSVESGSSSADWDIPVVLLRISTSRSVRGSSDWLENEKNLDYRRLQSTQRSWGVEWNPSMEIMGGTGPRGRSPGHCVWSSTAEMGFESGCITNTQQEPGQVLLTASQFPCL